MPQQSYQAFDPSEFEQAFDPEEFAAPTQEPTLPPAPRGWYGSMWDTAADYIPDPVKQAWDYTWAPTTDLPSRAASYVSEPLMQFGERNIDEWYGKPALYGGAYAQSLGDVLTGLTSPGNVGLTVATGGANLAARQGFQQALPVVAPRIAQGLQATGRALGGATAAHGVQTMASPDASMLERGMGLVEAVGGGFAARAPKPRAGQLDLPFEGAYQTPEVLPVKPPVAGQMDLPFNVDEFADFDLPLQRSAIPYSPDTPMPETLPVRPSAVAKPEGLQFIDPATGEQVLASQAQPGMIPVTAPETTTPGTRRVPPKAEQRATAESQYKNWLDELVRGEGGELDLERMGQTISRLARGGDELPSQLQADIRDLGLDNLTPEQADNAVGYYARRGRTDIADYLTDRYGQSGEQAQLRQMDIDDPLRPQEQQELNRIYGRTPEIVEVGEGVPPWNRQEMDSMPPDLLDSYVRSYERRTSPEAQAIVRYGQHLLEQRGEIIARRTREAEQSWENYPTDLTPEESFWKRREAPVTKGKTLEEVEAGKKTSAFERLGKLIGEERAQKLTSGEVVLEHSELPLRRGGKKRLPKGEVRRWAEWGDDQLAEFPNNPERPGLHVEVDEPFMQSMFPKAVRLVYRDAQGNPIGVLKSDMAGSGISTLAVDSKLGLRRGKVAFELLKQAFDQGLTEPSGVTSDMTNNLIQRVKKLVRSESGELDLETLYKNLNEMMSGIAESKAGKLVGRFIREESGELNPQAATTRLKQLFDKKRLGTLTPDELAEAQRLAQSQARTPEMPAPAARIASGPRGEPLTPKQEQIANATPEEITQSLSDRLKKATEDPNVAPQQISEMLDDLDETIRLNPVAASKANKPGIIRQVLGTNKALLTSHDFSAPGRQGKALILNKAWWTSLDDMFRAWGSQKGAELVAKSIEDHPSGYFKRGVDAKGKSTPSFAEKVGLDLASIEEPFQAQIFQKFEKYTGISKSSRAHTAFLNKLRSDQFVSMMNSSKKWGRNPEMDLVLARKYADFINSATGRGALKVGDWQLQRVTKELNDVMFAPKNMSGQIRTWNNVLNPVKYWNYDPTLRLQALRSLFAVAGAGVAVGSLADLAGLGRVSNDPYSSDFRKIKIGDTRIDPFGGYQQFPVAAAKLIMGKETPTSGEDVGQTRDLDERYRGRIPIAEKFFTNRLSPLGSFVWAWMSNREFDGKPFEYKRAVFERTLPIVAKDMWELGKEDPEIAAIMAIPSILGLAGTQHYTGR
jgi:hypothetical protein